MKLRATRGFCVGKGVDVAPGQVFDEPSAWQATYWLGLGVVEQVTDEETPKPVTAEATPLPKGSTRKG